MGYETDSLPAKVYTTSKTSSVENFMDEKKTWLPTWQDSFLKEFS
jgi:hypothetical protein